MSSLSAQKEPWDFRSFSSAYNTVAEQQGGFQLGNAPTPDELAHDYELSVEHTIQDFAYQVFLRLQRVD